MVENVSAQEPATLSQAVTGVVPPALREARIREAWPSVVGLSPAVASLGKTLERSIIFLPLGWLVLAPLFALKFAPFVCRRYTLTNRRLMIQRGLKPSPVEEVPLEQIDDVRLVEGSADTFFFTATLEVVSGGQVKMRLPG